MLMNQSILSTPITGDEAFAVFPAEDLIGADLPMIRQMVDDYDFYRCSLLDVQDVPRVS